MFYQAILQPFMKVKKKRSGTAEDLPNLDPEAEDDDEDDDVLSMIEASDAEDLLPLDADVPDGLIVYDGSDAGSNDEAEEWGGVTADGPTTKKRKRNENEDRKSRRKKLRSLPTFASYEDYAKLIEDGPEDNV